MAPPPQVRADIRKGILEGEVGTAFLRRFPGDARNGARTTWNLMLGEESTT